MKQKRFCCCHRAQSNGSACGEKQFQYTDSFPVSLNDLFKTLNLERPVRNISMFPFYGGGNWDPRRKKDWHPPPLPPNHTTMTKPKSGTKFPVSWVYSDICDVERGKIFESKILNTWAPDFIKLQIVQLSASHFSLLHLPHLWNNGFRMNDP